MDEVKRAFGRAVRIARLRRDWRQQDLADRAGIPRSYIGELEQGAREAGPTVQWKVSEALGMKLSELWELAERELRAERARTLPEPPEEG